MEEGKFEVRKGNRKSRTTSSLFYQTRPKNQKRLKGKRGKRGKSDGGGVSKINKRGL